MPDKPSRKPYGENRCAKPQNPQTGFESPRRPPAGAEQQRSENGGTVIRDRNRNRLLCRRKMVQQRKCNQRGTRPKKRAHQRDSRSMGKRPPVSRSSQRSPLQTRVRQKQTRHSRPGPFRLPSQHSTDRPRSTKCGFGHRISKRNHNLRCNSCCSRQTSRHRVHNR